MHSQFASQYQGSADPIAAWPFGETFETFGRLKLFDELYRRYRRFENHHGQAVP
jgi:hypothetical protein